MDLEAGSASFAVTARNLRSEPDPPRDGLEDVDILADLLVDTIDQGWLQLDSINVVEFAIQLGEWLSTGEPDDSFEYRSIDADDHAKLLWFRPWHGSWAVGSPWADAGPFLVEPPELIGACHRFLAEIREAVELRWSRWPLRPIK